MIDKEKKINKLQEIRQKLFYKNTSVLPIIVELQNFFVSENLPFRNKFEDVKNTMKYMLEYYVKGFEDKERQKIYLSEKKVLVKIIDRAIEFYKSKDVDLLSIYSRKTGEIEDVFDRFYHNFLGKQLLKDTQENTISVEDDDLEELFFTIWLTDFFSQSFVDKMLLFFDNPEVKFRDKAIILSAVTLSLFRIFDVNKFNFLLRLVGQESNIVSIRALIGIFLTVYIHNEHLFLFRDEIDKEFLQLTKNKGLANILKLIIVQFIKAKETEELIEEVNRELLPGMMKIQEDMPLDKLVNKENDDFLFENDEENPGWENFIDKNFDVFEKMQKFVEKQFSGSDIFSATIGKQKNHYFFQKPSNWFMPFTADNKEFENYLLNYFSSGVVDELLVTLEKTSYFCDSDKYAFCLNFTQMPKELAENAIKMVINEMKQSMEMIENDNANNELWEMQVVVTSYFQDLYRFFNFNNFIEDYDNIFEIDLDRHTVFSEFDGYSELEQLAAELYMQHGMFKPAANIFSYLAREKGEAEFFEKAGYSFQKLKNYDKALDNYKRAELFGTSKLWLNKKIAFVNFKLKRLEQAFEYYKKVEEEQPDNLQISMFIGRILMEQEKFDEALKYFYKIEYYEPDQVKILRYTAYCLYRTEKYEKALSYVETCIDKEPHSYDFFLGGDIKMLQNDVKEAYEYYLTAMSEFESFKKFIGVFNEHSEILKEKGVGEFDIALMTDALAKKYWRKLF